MSECMRCRRKLTGDEIGIYRKLINREAGQFLCKTCLARELNVEEDRIDAKIRQFKKTGCALFASEPIR